MYQARIDICKIGCCRRGRYLASGAVQTVELDGGAGFDRQYWLVAIILRVMDILVIPSDVVVDLAGSCHKILSRVSEWSLAWPMSRLGSHNGWCESVPPC